MPFFHNITRPHTVDLAACPTCGRLKNGVVSCCGVGGSWQGECGSAGDTQFRHTWGDGKDACSHIANPEPVTKSETITKPESVTKSESVTRSSAGTYARLVICFCSAKVVNVSSEEKEVCLCFFYGVLKALLFFVVVP